MILHPKQLFSKSFELKIHPFFRINLFFFPVVFFAIHGSYGGLFLTAYSAALVHELAHVFCARMLGIGISRIILLPFGLTAKLCSEYIKSSEKEFLIAFSGPFTNIILFWISSIMKSFVTFTYLDFFADINFSMAILNLIPVLPLDGGRMMKSILVLKLGYIRAYTLMLRFSKPVVAALLVTAFCLFFQSGFNFSLILVSAFLLQNLSTEQKLLSHIALREILENPTKLKERTLLPAKTFCASETASASVLLKLLSYDYFCIINVIDENNHITNILTETHILEHITRYGIRIKLSDIKD